MPPHQGLLSEEEKEEALELRTEELRRRLASACQLKRALGPEWEQHWSDLHGVHYYWNSRTKESRWIRPQGVLIAFSTMAGADAAGSGVGASDSGARGSELDTGGSVAAPSDKPAEAPALYYGQRCRTSATSGAVSSNSMGSTESNARASPASAGVGPMTWEFELRDSTWAQYHSKDSLLVEQIWESWQASPNPQDGENVFNVEMSGTAYAINFRDMTQRNTRTGRLRRIRRVVSKADATVEHELQLAQDKIRQLESANMMLLSSSQKSLSSQRSETRTMEDTVMQLQEELESWKRLHLTSCPLPAPQFRSRPHLVKAVQDMLRASVPRHHRSGQCRGASEIIVEKVEEVVNISTWKQYSVRKQNTIDALRERRDCPWLDAVAPPACKLQRYLPHIALDRSANEALLLHGTPSSNVQHILRQGFDDRLAGRDLYGAGLYLTSDFCKAAQYTTEGCCVFLARVVLGHPYMATGPMKTHKRPPIAEPHGVPHDSVIASPGIPNGNGRKDKQVHWEFVVPSEQAYPELLVHFRYPPRANA